MPYDQQGNFYGSDEDLDALEAKYTKPDYASQIPGQVSSSRSNEPRSLRDRAVLALTQANPLMMRKSFEDMTKTLVGGAALPVVAPISAGVQALNALPGNMLRRSRGEEEIQTPSAEDLMRKYGQAIAPQTSSGQNFQEGVAKLMDILKVPAASPVVPNAPRRPILTPDDVRVGAGQVKQLAKEIRETPADFQAAQSGLKRQNLYGEDTLGVKAQAAADALGDTLERRRSAGLSTIPGLPQALTPETSMYAVRPAKSTLTRPKMTEGSEGFIPEIYGVEDVISNVYGDTPAAKMPSTMVMHEYAKRFLPSDGALAPVREAVSKFSDQKIAEMFPDAPSPGHASRAFDVGFSNREARNAKQLEFVSEFFETPEGQALKEQYGIPSPEEFTQRYGEAERVIKGPFATFMSRNVGAEGDALAKLARKGIVIDPEANQDLDYLVDKAALAEKRIKAGFPAMGSFHEELLSKTSELDALNEEIAQLEDARRPLFEQAQANGQDPASIPEYAETTNPLRQKLRQREKLQEDVGNVRTAQNVENINDSIVKLAGTKEMLSKIPYEQRQFYPSVTNAKPKETHYASEGKYLKNIGFETLGRQLLEDILAGKVGDTKNINIEKFIKGKHLDRVQAEKVAQEAQKQYISLFDQYNQERLKTDPTTQNFGPASVITLNKDTPKDLALRDVSADTLALDICIGEGCAMPSKYRNIFTGKEQRRGPIIDPATGQRAKNVKDNAYSSYVNNLNRGGELARFMDSETGRPAAVIELNKNSSGQFVLGYASGYDNGRIDPKYAPAVRDFLNLRADDIYGSGPHLNDNTGVYDTVSPSEWRSVTQRAGLTEDQAKLLEVQGDAVPRFVTIDDVKDLAKGIVPTPIEVAVRNRALQQRPETPPATQPPNRPVQNFTADDYNELVEGFESALDNAATWSLEDSQLDEPDLVESRINSIGTDIFNLRLNDREGVARDPVTRLRQAEQDIANQITDSRGQGDDFGDEVAAGLETLLLDLQGIRERYEEQAVAVTPPAVQNGAQQQGRPIPNMSADELLAGYGDQMTREQRGWLEAFIENWEQNVDDTPAGEGYANQMTRAYDEWRANNSLGPDPLANLFDDITFEPDPTAVANRPTQPYTPQDVLLARQLIEIEREPDGSISQGGIASTEYALQTGQLDHPSVNNIPPGPERARALEPVLRAFREQVDTEIRPAPQLPAPQVANAARVPRPVQALSMPDLQAGLLGAELAAATRISRQYFDDNIFDDNTPISSVTNVLRNYDIGIHQGTDFMVRELAARQLEQMYTEAVQDAETITNTLDESIYQDLEGPEEAMRRVDRAISSLQRHGELAWEDLLGPLAVDYPWSRNLQARTIENLQSIADGYRRQRDEGEGFAKGGMVEKKRKAKKPRIPLLVTRKNPELAEMAYRYGGMVM